MQRKRKERIQKKEGESTDIIRLWCLRMLMRCGGYRKFIKRRGFTDDDVLLALGMESYIDREIERKEALDILRRLHCEAESGRYEIPGNLRLNLPLILNRISLNKVEADVLVFSVLLHAEAGMRECADLLGRMDKGKLVRHLSVILGHAEREISSALASRGQLAVSGLLTIDNSWSHDLKHKLDLMSGLADEMLTPNMNDSGLFSSSFRKSPAPSLCIQDFGHVERELRLLVSYLSQCIAGGTTGVNILLYGKPGTGKTEMVRVLAREIGATLHEISMEDRDGDPLTGSRRFSAYRLSQQLLKHQPESLILFDEVEDVFPEKHREQRDRTGKAWINHMLESNPVPALWLSNRVGQIDPAFLRRFDYVMEMSVPTCSVRKRMFRKYLHDVPVQEAWLDHVSRQSEIMPAHIAKAARVVQHMKVDDAAANQDAVEQVLEGMQQVLGHSMRFGDCGAQDTRYDPALISADADIERLLAGLAGSGRGNLCFYGPPGTGKTALGRHIADHLDRPLLLRRASDILSMWVGGTEKNIAGMFREAERERAVLMLDEADSFLRDRRGANRSWEVTQVNELLVQMEHFDGLFICSTNLMDGSRSGQPAAFRDQDSFRLSDARPSPSHAAAGVHGRGIGITSARYCGHEDADAGRFRGSEKAAFSTWNGCECGCPDP